MFEYDVKTISETGTSHIRNEDRSLIVTNGRCIWLGVFDGISHGGGGAIAAQTAHDAMIKVLGNNDACNDITSTGKAILCTAQEAVLKEQVACGSNPNMGTTAIVSCINKEKQLLYWFAIGDSALFLCREGVRPEKLTIEDSPNGYLLAQGKISANKMTKMPAGNALNWYIGKPVEPMELWEHVHKGRLTIGRDDSVILCTDGLYSKIPRKKMGREINKSSDLERTLSTLVNTAIENGSEDDITIVCAKPINEQGAKKKFRGAVLAVALFCFACGFLCGAVLNFWMKENAPCFRPNMQEKVTDIPPMDTLIIITQ